MAVDTDESSNGKPNIWYFDPRCFRPEEFKNKDWIFYQVPTDSDAPLGKLPKEELDRVFDLVRDVHSNPRLHRCHSGGMIGEVAVLIVDY